MISLVICTYFAFCKLFSHIRKIKNVKRVKVLKEKSRDLKKKDQKEYENEPQQKRDKIDHESDANSNATTFYFTLQNKDCV